MARHELPACVGAPSRRSAPPRAGEAIKPIALALRLFGMVFASALMVMLIGEILPAPFAVVPHTLWTVFDVFIGAIQAYIFALLTVLYFQAVLPRTRGLTDEPAAHATHGRLALKGGR